MATTAEKAEGVKVSPLEKAIVNAFTPVDLLPDIIQDYQRGTASVEQSLSRARRMWNGKIEDYRRFVVIAQENGGKLPEELDKLFRVHPWSNHPLLREIEFYSPCGAAKQAALMLRDY